MVTYHHENSGHNSLQVQIVTTMEQLIQVFALRSICFMDEAGLPFDHAFDANDLQATHVVAYDGTEPVGAMRIRWFKDFAKLERTAFRKTHRGIANVKTISNFAFRHIARKGYSRVITHASPIFARLWRTHFGFTQDREKSPVVYHDEKYVELVKMLEVPANAIIQETDIAILFRPEGAWDNPTKYEQT